MRNSTSGFERSNAINYRPAKGKHTADKTQATWKAKRMHALVVRNIEPSTPATLEEHLLSLIDKLFPMALPLNTTKLFQTLTDGRVATVDTDGYDRRDVRSSLHTIIHTTSAPRFTFGRVLMHMKTRNGACSPSNSDSSGRSSEDFNAI